MADFPERATNADTYLPADDRPPDADEDLDLLDDALISGFPESDEDILDTATPPPLGRSWAFDFSRGGFLFGHETGPTAVGAHSPLSTHGFDTLKGWIDKCLHTERGAHPIHPDGYGMVRPFDLIGEQVAGAPVADLEQRVRDALTFHPRIVDVVDFAADIDLEREYINATFTVVTDQGEALSFEDVTLT
jgi:hypothetical protein